MEPIVARPWQRLKLYKCIVTQQEFETNSTQLEHILSEEEKVLHDYRNRINEYETKGNNWEYYKKIVNPYELVYTQKKYDNFPTSLCLLKPLSRSYFKMVEMLDIINFFGTFKIDNIRTAHVCEGPGGFIEALMDEAFRNKKKVQLSIAMTLRSRQTNIPGWRRATQFLQNNKHIKILYGEDGTGNIMKTENQDFFINYATHPSYGGKINIFTADGGFDFSCDYSKQEKLIFPLLVASTRIGFEVLKKGGLFILKIFDCYNKSTVDLVHFLSSHFTEWTLYKPAISRPCNPEQYFIGKGFTECTEKTLDVLKIWCLMLEVEQQVDSLYTSDYSDEFKEIIKSLREKSFKTQIEYLEQVFNIIDSNDDGIIQEYLKKNEKLSFDWCNRFRVPIYPQRYHSIGV